MAVRGGANDKKSYYRNNNIDKILIDPLDPFDRLQHVGVTRLACPLTGSREYRQLGTCVAERVISRYSSSTVRIMLFRAVITVLIGTETSFELLTDSK